MTDYHLFTLKYAVCVIVCIPLQQAYSQIYIYIFFIIY